VIAVTHHERHDGRGYPNGLRGDAIPLPGRIAAVADVFDALTSDRVYKVAMPLEQAIAIIREGAGSQFCPDVVAAFDASLDEIVATCATAAPPVAPLTVAA
jgi:putative two-component system response regulator